MGTPTRARKRLGAFLAEQRNNSGTPADAAARELRTTTATVHRYEAGAVKPTWATVVTLLTFYGAQKQLTRASQLWDAMNDEAPPVRLPRSVTMAFRRLVQAERDATEYLGIWPLVVPGLLQTASYARALNATAGQYVDPDSVENVVQLRLKRQRLLESPEPLSCRIVMDEAVVRREVGGPDVMREQLARLLDLSGRRNVTLRIVPFSAGAYGTMSGSCTVLRYPSDPPDAYLEFSSGGAWVENESDVTKIIEMFEAAVDSALDEDATAELISRQIRKFS